MLIIDDEPYVRDVLRDLLGFMGHTVDTAADGDEGLRLFERGRHQLVITDLVMSGPSGWDVIERVRRVDPGVRLIILSGGATGDDVMRARTASVPLLSKPVHIVALEAAVATPAAREGSSSGGTSGHD